MSYTTGFESQERGRLMESKAKIGARPYEQARIKVAVFELFAHLTVRRQ